MAESAAFALLNVIFEKLTDEAFKRYARSQKIHSELKELQTTLTQIKDLINDASNKEITNESVRLWLNSLQHLAYDIDDILDGVATQAMHRELTHESGTIISKVKKVIPTCCKNLSLTQSLHHKLDSINAKLQYLEKQKGDLGLIVKVEKQKNTSNSRGNETSLLESDVVGRESEKNRLLKKLLGDDESCKENFSILPIVGMGGIGKTTLARLLYNDTHVKGWFELHVWVCVSDDFDIFKISKTIFQAVSGENKEFQDLNQLQVALKEKLKDKRFLLVLDDVWNENYDDWETLALPFHSGARGSRVILTTRKHELLKKIGFNRLDNLERLSHEDALSLFAIHALGVDNFDSHATLKPQGEGIVKKCDGLPLALKAIGRLLRTKADGEDWDDVLNSEIWDLENGTEIVPALRLSYHDLSAELKQLFAYCSLFPKDFLFNKEELVLLWMAEGYLDQSSENKSLERSGHEYFDKLLSRSFFQQAPNDKSLFVMHDLMNDLATFVAREYFLRFDKQMEVTHEALAKYRHMSFIRENYVGYQKFKAFERARNLRSLLAVYAGVEESWNQFFLSNKILVDVLPQLPLLRVLSLSRFRISEVPDLIGDLKHLRYLNLSLTLIKELPENFGNLYNLQTLIVCGCRHLTTLPKNFLKLKKLRHFDIRDTPFLKRLPLGIGELRHLQTLPKVIIGGDSDFAITELKGLKNLHGGISIEGLHEVQSPMDAQEANLSLKRLTKLELKWGDGSRRGTFDTEILNELTPNIDTLNHLHVVNYGGIEFPGWVGDPSFHELVHVSLRSCRNCTSLPPFGQLTSLKGLFVQGMDEVKVISLESTRSIDVAFPSLETLWFEDMPGWEVWSANGNVIDAVFPRLRELYIKDCPKLNDVSLQSLPSLRVLQTRKCSDGVLRSLVHAASSITELTVESILGLSDEVWRGVIKYLGAVELVSIRDCNEIRYLWESEAEASKVFENLKELNLRGCSNLLSLGEKEEEEEDNFGCNVLSSLRLLDVQSCGSMERCCCPNSIERLKIYSCSLLTNVSFPKVTGGGGQKLKSLSVSECRKLMETITNTCMPTLEDIWIYNWRNLKSIIKLSNFNLLTRMGIYNCPSIESFPNIQLSNLTGLTILGCQNLKSLPDLHLLNLTSLTISECGSMESFDLQLMNLTMLNYLEIRDCPNIDASFPRGHWPPKLSSLRIGGLKKPVSEWGPQNFPASLVDLRLWGDPHVSNFSQLSYLFPTSLTRLRIFQFDKLESLSTGLQHLTSLQHLKIWSCPKIKHLPETLLPSLLSLEISYCRNLEERCNGRVSHYWALISHIPCIRISPQYTGVTQL